MRHLHILFIPGRHRSGLFFILVLILLTDIGDVGDPFRCPRSAVQDALKAATGWYFAAHPPFSSRGTQLQNGAKFDQETLGRRAELNGASMSDHSDGG